MSERRNNSQGGAPPFTDSIDRKQQMLREKAKARELRHSQWWRQMIGRALCYHCGQKFSAADLTMDHLLPIAQGGKSTKKNCVPSCKECNTKKGHKQV